MQRKKVFVAMSGGVDSSVAAALLQKEGFDVFGVFMQGWTNPNFDCQWETDRKDAARVAAHLGIPFRVLDVSRDYYEHVVTYLIDEYKVGRTPNPDVMCNKKIKFGVFYNWAVAQGADFIATGHYTKKEGWRLLKARDSNKDQTYFLWALPPEIIEKSLFPIGSYTKPEVRALAREFGLPTAEKKDSQGICFLGKGSMPEFLKEYMEPTLGEIKTASGRRVGEHVGVEFLTIGQRHGVGVLGGEKPYYVAEKDLKTAAVIVAETENDPILYQKEILYKNSNWLDSVSFPFACEARIRYRAPLAHCRVEDGRAIFDESQRAVAPGQSIVFYKGDQLLGGGIIS